MAEDKKSFILYVDQRGVFEKLSDDQAGKLIKHIFSYCNDEDPEGDFVTELAFELIKQQLKRDLKKYQNIVDRNKKNGAKGGRPKKQEEPKKPSGLSGNPEKPQKADTVNGNDTVIDNVKDIKIKYSDEVLQTYTTCLKYFPVDLHPKNKNSWLDVIEKLNRLDKIPFDKIVEVTKRTRADDFWKKQFLSLTKLRTNDKNKVQYFKVFNNQGSSQKKTATNSKDFTEKTERAHFGFGGNQ